MSQVGPVEPWRPADSVLPALVYGPACSTEIELHNLAGRGVTVEIEGHRASGALVGLAGWPGSTVRLEPHERRNVRLEIAEETGQAWARVRERAPPDGWAAVAVGASTECIHGDRLRSVRRDVAYPQRSPWFDSEIGSIPGGVVSLINASAESALAHLCYSMGNLFSVPGVVRAGELVPVCSLAYDVLVPPFGARDFPVQWNGSSHLTLRTRGSSIVLEMLRPLDAQVRVYQVDSTIRFEGEPGRE